MRLTLAEAAQRIGNKSETTVRKLIKDGKIKAEKDGRRWVVTDLGNQEQPGYGGEQTALTEQLKSEIEYLRKENEELRRQLEDTRSRSDMIILRLADGVKLLEHKREPFWRRWRRKPGQAGEIPEEDAIS